jgi:hypothetical protein
MNTVSRCKFALFTLHVVVRFLVFWESLNLRDSEPAIMEQNIKIERTKVRKKGILKQML